jgi:hypothetical protein
VEESLKNESLFTRLLSLRCFLQAQLTIRVIGRPVSGAKKRLPLYSIAKCATAERNISRHKRATKLSGNKICVYAGGEPCSNIKPKTLILHFSLVLLLLLPLLQILGRAQHDGAPS